MLGAGGSSSCGTQLAPRKNAASVKDRLLSSLSHTGDGWDPPKWAKSTILRPDV